MRAFADTHVTLAPAFAGHCHALHRTLAQLEQQLLAIAWVEIAQQLGIELVTVRTRLARALSKLAKVMTRPPKS